MPVSHDGLVLISGKNKDAQTTKVIKGRKWTLIVYLYLSLQIEARQVSTVRTSKLSRHERFNH